MKPPTPEELARAHDEITAEGAAASTTLHLAALAITDPTLKAIVQRMTESHVANFSPELKTFAAAIVSGAIISGLNHGIRIGENRHEVRS